MGPPPRDSRNRLTAMLSHGGAYELVRTNEQIPMADTTPSSSLSSSSTSISLPAPSVPVPCQRLRGTRPPPIDPLPAQR